MKAISLISGGLDSILAAKFVQKLGIEVIPLHFEIPFCHKNKKTNSKSGITLLTTENLNIELKSLDISNDFLKLLVSPRYGFGSNMNPCIDCKILMLSKAKELMPEFNAQFVITGEVLGQRPMSQHRKALELIEKRSGLEGFILRPLSAKLLSETIPEKNGWVERNKLLNFNGRSRKPQINLAKELKIEEYANPAGGCLLTDPRFTARLRDLMAHKELNLDNIELLKIGRHFRLTDQAKLVVGRDEKEDKELMALARAGDCLFLPNEELAGPTSLGRGIFDEELVKLSCSITCRYCDLNGKREGRIVYRKVGTVLFGDSPYLKTAPIDESQLTALRI